VTKLPDAPQLLIDEVALSEVILRDGSVRTPLHAGACGDGIPAGPDFVVEIREPIPTLHLRARGGTSRVLLQWHRPDGRDLECGVGTMAETTLELAAPAPGTYHLSIGGLAPGPYELRIGAEPERARAPGDTGRATTVTFQGTTTGGLTTSAVDAVVRDRLDEVRVCFEESLDRREVNGRRELSLSFNIDEQGAIWSIGRETIGGAPLDTLERCVIAAAERWRFPKARGTVATYAITLAERQANER
jgi:hypothetical protein